jgi:hypothetical protein
MIVLFGGTLNVGPANAAAVHYVTPDGTGDCSSWANTCTLQTALTYAGNGDQIWAVAGTYKPSMGTNREATFQLKSGVALYGGFVGAETERNQRDPTLNLTILSGDIDNNDSQMPIITDIATVTGNTTNSYHVVTGATDAILDGFIITAGNANDISGSNAGGGQYNNSSNPVLTNVIFSGNSAVYYGGGMYNKDSDPMLTNVTFDGNAAQEGGGMMNFAGSDPTLGGVTFIDNLAAMCGGAISNLLSSHPTLTNVTFSGNDATICGGAMENYADCDPTLTNVTFSGNSADKGGGIYNVASSPTIRNTIFWHNTSQIYNYDIDSSPLVGDSVVQGGYTGGTNIITTDPMLGTLGDYGGSTQTISLLTGSSAIDAGNDTFCPTTDQRGVARPQGSQCDIGAYEKVLPLFLPVILR